MLQGHPEEGWSFTELVHPKHTALVVIDMQNDFCSSKGVFAGMSFDISEAKRVSPSIIDVLNTGRQVGAMVIHTRSSYDANTDSPVFKRKRPGWADVITRSGSWGADTYEDFPELRPLPNEHVIYKRRYSAFLDTDLHLVLRSKGIRCLVYTGTASNVCVESTARDGFQLDYHTVIVEDCCFTYDATLHEATMRSLSNHFGYLINSKQLIGTWLELVKPSS